MTSSHRSYTAWQCGSSAMPAPPRTSPRTCSSRSGSGPTRSIPTAGRSARGSAPSPTVVPSITCSLMARRRPPINEAAGPEAAPDGDVEEMAMALVTAERVRSALATLPDEQRRAIQLAYFGGKTYRQVAEVLGIPEGTAKSRLRLGLRRIADVLETESVARSE